MLEFYLSPTNKKQVMTNLDKWEVEGGLRFLQSRLHINSPLQVAKVLVKYTVCYEEIFKEFGLKAYQFGRNF